MVQATATAVLLVLSGVWTGAIVTIAWERLPIWGRLEVTAFAVDFRRSLRRMDPTMPIVAVIILGLGIVHAVQHPGPARVLALSGVACVGLIVAGSIALMEPINLKFRRLPEGTPPPHAEALRARWRILHTARAVLAVTGLTLFVLATVN